MYQSCAQASAPPLSVCTGAVDARSAPEHVTALGAAVSESASLLLDLLHVAHAAGVAERLGAVGARAPHRGHLLARTGAQYYD